MDSDGEDYYDDNDSSEQNDDDLDEEFLSESSVPNVDAELSTNMEEDVFSYQCLSPEEVVSLMTESIRDVNEILNVSFYSLILKQFPPLQIFL